MKPALSILWRAAAAVLSLAGLAAFVLLFVRDMTIYWFILSPLIFAVYQIPAVIVFALWKRKRRRDLGPEGIEDGEDEESGGAPKNVDG